ncbi:MAG: hypothetical protein ACYSYU_07005 [Planctomycetota bacterium]|jgi:hypothetical protein
MEREQKQKHDDKTLKGLENRLRSLRHVEPSQTLVDRLLAGVPDRGSKATGRFEIKWFVRIWDFGAMTAAAVLVFALMLAINYGLATPSQSLSAGLDEVSLGSIRQNLNNGFIVSSPPYAFEWSIASLNEPQN